MIDSEKMLAMDQLTGEQEALMLKLVNIHEIANPDPNVRQWIEDVETGKAKGVDGDNFAIIRVSRGVLVAVETAVDEGFSSELSCGHGPARNDLNMIELATSRAEEFVEYEEAEMLQ